MTHTEIATAIAALQPSEVEDVANKTIDAVEAAKSVAEVVAFRNALLTAGVDVTGLCKKKHPV
jgi:hypothetical protein